MLTLGLNLISHDTSAVLLRDGQVTCGVCEERFNHEKHTKAFPIRSIEACLREARANINDVGTIAVGWDFQRFIQELYLKPSLEDRGKLSYLLRDIVKIGEMFRAEEHIRSSLGFHGKVRFWNHHIAHIASAFFSSPFQEALCLSLDGYGEKESTVVAWCCDDAITPLWRQEFPHSLGLYYAAFTHFLGYRHHCDEGIVMGLASYGNPRAVNPRTGRSYYDDIAATLLWDNGAFWINGDWLDVGYARNSWVTPRLVEALGPRRAPRSGIEESHMHIAAAVQARLEDIVVELMRPFIDQHECGSTCVAGGVALNCVMNTRLMDRLGIEQLWVPSAPADNGVALGAALLSFIEDGKPASPFRVRVRPGLGPSYSDHECEKALLECGLKGSRPADPIAVIAERLAAGKIVGWFDGCSEFGPRALGHRSILTRPYPGEMKDYLNRRVKFRDEFRLFAPIVKMERAHEYFQMRGPSPYMMHAFGVRQEFAPQIAATVHVDGTCRTQTVTKDDTPRLYDLLGAFESLTKVPVLLNTSFNVKGQPIVESPADAAKTFASTAIDVLYLQGLVVEKEQQ